MRFLHPYFILFSFVLLQLLNVPTMRAQDFGGLTYDQLDTKMKAFYQKGNYESAAACMKQGMIKAKAEFGSKDSIYAGYVAQLGFFYMLSAQYQKAESLFLEAIDILGKIFGKTHPRYATALDHLGNLYKKTSRYEEAESFCLEAKAIREQILSQTKPKLEEQQAQADYVSSLNNLADLYKVMGLYESSKPLFLQVIKIIREVFGKDHPRYARALNNLANLYVDRERYDEAHALYTQSLTITAKSLGETSPFYAESLDNLASLYSKLGKNEEAEPLYLLSLAINKKTLGKTHPNYLKSLSNLAVFYQSIDNYEAAEPLLLEAKETCGKIHDKNNPDYIKTLNNLAKLYRKMNKLDTAFTYCITAIALNFEAFDSIFPGIFKGLSDEDIYSLSNGKVKHSHYLQFAQLKYRSAPELNLSIRTLMKILKARYKNTAKEDKMYFVKLHQYYNLCVAAIQIHDQIHNGFSGRENKLRALKKNSIFVKSAINATLEMNEAIHYAEAFSFAEQNKSVLLADAVKGARARVLGDLPDSLALLEISLQDQMDNLKRKKHRVIEDSEKLSILEKENQLNGKIQRFLKSLKDKYPKYHALKYENITANAADVQALLDENTLLLEYFVTKKITYLFAISKHQVELFPIAIGKSELRFNIMPMRYALSDYRMIIEEKHQAYSLYTENAFWFYNTLLAVALEGKKVKNLIIVTDDELGHLPFESFLVEEAPQQKIDYQNLHYLINDYNISYNYSATLWKEHLSKKKRSNNHQMLACASSYPEVDSSLLALRLPHIYSLRTRLLPLPAVKEEVKALSKNFEGHFLQELASNERFFKENAHQFGIIHLAMHGLLHPHVPMFSSLAFSENKDSLEDNFLQAYEISRLKLNADLVVLSACETGFGKFEQGEGVISLARSFMYAGIPSLVVSLWPVSDKSTAIIMESFYQNLEKGLPKDEGLRLAKLHYLNIAKGVEGHPAFWSPFIQLGDKRPIEVATKSGWLPWLIGGGLMLLLIGLLRRRFL